MARRINLKCCSPKGIPMIVTQSKMPNISSIIAIHNPAKINQITFNTKEITGILPPVSWTDFPNGARWAIPIFIACKPKGRPIIVRQRINPPHKYPRQVRNPPKISQITLPINRIFVYVQFDNDRCNLQYFFQVEMKMVIYYGFHLQLLICNSYFNIKFGVCIRFV